MKLAMIASQFPELHETFVAREFVALREAGIPLRIYSLKPCRDKIVHPEAQKNGDITTYLVWNDPGVWLQALVGLVRHPRRALANLRWVLGEHYWPPKETIKALIVWLQAIAVAQHMRREGITHIHAHWATMPTTAAVLCAQWLDLPYSFTAHAWDIFVYNRSLKAKVDGAVRVITCTEYNRRYLVHLCPEAKDKIFLNYHGVDTDKFKCDPYSCRTPATVNDEPPLLLSIGRFVETKGFDTLLDAYGLLKRRGVSFKAVLVGRGPLLERLIKRIADYDLQDQVQLHSAMSQAQLREQYQNAFCFIMPSVIARNGDRDGIPNVVFEAMAMGKPVVATSISGIPEAVDDKRTGLIVPPRDPERLADAINLLLQRPTWAHVLGDHACMWVQVQFSAKEHMARLVQQMQSLLRSSDRRKGPPDRRRSTRAMRGGRRQSDQIQAVPVERAPLRIMYVIWSLEVGGAERVVVQQALGIDRTRFEPMVVCLNHQGRLAHSVREAGVEVVALEKSPGVDLSLPFKLAQLIRMHKIDIVHAHLWGAALWARLAIVLARRGIVIVQEHGMQAWRGRPHFWVDRLLHPLTRRILFVSHDVRKQYLKRSRVPPVKCQLIPNGVVTEHVFESKAQIRERFAWESSELIILSVGRLAAEKGHIDLVDAFAKIASRVPHARLILVGDGPERVRLEASMRQHHLQGRIVFAGIQDDVPYWMKAADIYVQPSHREALSLAILEAMSMGLTVVATRVGEVENVITDGVHGYLVPPHDPQALADKLLEVCSHIEEGLPVSAAAQQVIRERYSLQRMLDVVQAIYDEEVPLHRSL